MEDFYKLGNNYINRLVEAGCTPIGLAPSNNWLSEEALDMCDGFLVQGGSKFCPYHFQVIHYAITHGKRYLGICLGQQLIYVYFELKRIVEERLPHTTPHSLQALRCKRQHQGTEMNAHQEATRI